MTQKPKRPNIPDPIKLSVWANAAGRCVICNVVVTRNEEMGEAVLIGEIAHNVGWSENSPRGDDSLALDVRNLEENLILLCRNCHKPADDNGVIDRYSVEKLHQLKIDHEKRVRFLMDIGADKKATIIRMVGDIRGVSPELTYATVLDATVAAGYYPSLLPYAHKNELEINLRHQAGSGSQEYFTSSAKLIDEKMKTVTEGVRTEDLSRLAVFGFARIPLLIHLGSRLDDKLQTLLFQRQRGDEDRAWTWPGEDSTAPEFETTVLHEGEGNVSVLFNISGTIDPVDVYPSVGKNCMLYVVQPAALAQSNPSLINSRQALLNFETAVRALLAKIEKRHGKLTHINLFSAVPLSAAISIGRVLMPNVSPTLNVYDRDDKGNFFLALEVKK